MPALAAYILKCIHLKQQCFLKSYREIIAKTNISLPEIILFLISGILNKLLECYICEWDKREMIQK